MSDVRAIAWDFDGVLNANIQGGRFRWIEGFEAAFGQPLAPFVAQTFERDWRPVMVGQVDLKDRIAAWCNAVGYAPGPDAFIAEMFARDAFPDPEMLDRLDCFARQGLRQVIATNNEARRAAYIADEMGFGPRVERIFASGTLGVAKPDAAFFARITDAMGLEPAQMLLIDDLARNVDAARAAGWAAIHFRGGGYAALDDALRALGLDPTG